MNHLNPKFQKNWTGLWYALGREVGINDTMTFMKINSRTREVKWTFQSHEESDGLGWLVTLLRNEGGTIPEVPRGKNRPLRMRDWMRLVPRFLRDIRPQAKPWKSTLTPTHPHNNFEVAWEVFTAQETKLLKTRSARKGLSVSAALLEQFNTAIYKRFADPNKKSAWLFPVNMRGMVTGYSEIQNQSSAVGVRCWEGISAGGLYENIRSSLQANIHVATWHTLHIGKLVGLRGMRWLSRRRANKNFWLGTFSNMGALPLADWKLAPTPTQQDEFWIASPPGTPSFPVGICCLTWNGRLAMSLKIHPSLGAEFPEVQQILRQVKEEMQRQWMTESARETQAAA